MIRGPLPLGLQPDAIFQAPSTSNQIGTAAKRIEKTETAACQPPNMTVHKSVKTAAAEGVVEVAEVVEFVGVAAPKAREESVEIVSAVGVRADEASAPLAKK